MRTTLESADPCAAMAHAHEGIRRTVGHKGYQSVSASPRSRCDCQRPSPPPANHCRRDHRARPPPFDSRPHSPGWQPPATGPRQHRTAATIVAPPAGSGGRGSTGRLRTSGSRPGTSSRVPLGKMTRSTVSVGGSDRIRTAANEAGCRGIRVGTGAPGAGTRPGTVSARRCRQRYRIAIDTPSARQNSAAFPGRF